ncbi:unnamed protein product, partial [Timema podura]|nr:unnamed protein product [Timema podura]
MNRKGATRKHGEEAKNCPICDFFGEDSLDLKAHLETPRHLYNFMLKRFKTSRKRMVQDRHKVTVTVNCSTHSVEQLKDGTAKTK